MVDEVKEIPTAPEDYYDRGEHAYKRRTLVVYKEMVFRDSSERWFKNRPKDMSPDNPMQWSMRHYHTIEHYTPEIQDDKVSSRKDDIVNYDWDWKEDGIFGGFEGFFSQDVRMLDLGSGHGQVVQKINDKYSQLNIRCIGVDYRYRADRPEKTANLVGGDFKDLPFVSNSFDRILSVESFPAWLPHKAETLQRYFREITRISQVNAIWRGTLPTYEEHEQPKISIDKLIFYFTRNGWEVVIDKGSNSFAAKLVFKK